MTDQLAQLVTLLASRSCERGRFLLASGRESDLYIDVRRAVLAPRGFDLIGRLLFAELRASGLRRAGGLATGAIPLVGAVLARAAAEDYPLEGFFVRPAAKDHGTGREIEGCFDPAVPSAILEDVITTGASALRAAEAVKRAGGRVALVLAVVDREEGGAAALDAAGYALRALTTRRDLAAALDALKSSPAGRKQ